MTEPGFQPGDLVEIKDLKQHPENNGKQVSILGYDEDKSRWNVQLSPSTTKKFQARNLKLVKAKSELAAASADKGDASAAQNAACRPRSRSRSQRGRSEKKKDNKDRSGTSSPAAKLQDETQPESSTKASADSGSKMASQENNRNSSKVTSSQHAKQESTESETRSAPLATSPKKVRSRSRSRGERSKRIAEDKPRVQISPIFVPKQGAAKPETKVEKTTGGRCDTPQRSIQSYAEVVASPQSDQWQRSNFATAPDGGKSWGRGKGGKGGKGTFGAKGAFSGKGGQSGRDFQISKCLARILRHAAHDMGLHIRPDGYCLASDLLALGDFRSMGATLADLEQVVASNDKKRFELCREGDDVLIRAVQGHSMKVVSDDSLLQRITANDADLPSVCVHGTYHKSIGNILKQGLIAGAGTMDRNHVHFAPFEPGDGRVISGMRYNCEVAVYVDIKRAILEGVPFFRSTNQVILSPGIKGVVPLKFIKGAKDINTGRWIKGGP